MLETSSSQPWICMSMQSGMASGKSYSCLWLKGRAGAVVLPSDFGSLQTWQACLGTCLSPGTVGFHAAQLPGCSLWGRAHPRHTVTCHGRAESQWSLPSLLAAALVAALGQPVVFVLSLSLRHGWGFAIAHTLPVLPVRVTNPTCTSFSLQGSEPLPCFTTLCQNPFANPARITTAFSGVRSRVSDLPTVLGNDALAFQQNLLICYF